MSVYFLQNQNILGDVCAPGRLSCSHKLIHPDRMSATQQQCHQQHGDSVGALYDYVVFKKWVKNKQF